MVMPRMLLIAASLLGTVACGNSEPTHRSPKNAREPLPSLDEQRSAARDPLHAPYLTLLYAASNLDSCERGNDVRVVAVTNEREETEAIAKAKGFEPSLQLTRRIFLMRLAAELHAKCYPDFPTALKEMKQVVSSVRDQVQRLPDRSK
jgi:hypothetical protein